MPILIDGNNLLHRLPRSDRSRERVRRLVLNTCRRERVQVTVVFDGPPPQGAPGRENLGPVTVVYAGSSTADDVIIGRLPSGPGAGDWVVVTDDRELQARARSSGAKIRSLAEWQKKRQPPPSKPRAEPKLSSREVEEWEEFFFGERQDNDGSRE
jgi:hypothetical protein